MLEVVLRIMGNAVSVGTVVLVALLLICERRGLRPGSLNSYRTALALHVPAELAVMRLDKITPQQLNDLYAQLLVKGRRDGRGGLSPRTVRYLHTLLQKAFSDAVRLGVTDLNPALASDPPSARSARSPVFPVWSPLELRRFLSAAREDPLYAAFYLAASTGLRRGELLGLRWCDIDFEAGDLQVVQTLVEVAHQPRLGQPKTDSSRRRVALDRRTLDVLRTHRAKREQELAVSGRRLPGSDFVFLTRAGHSIHPALFSYYFQRRVRTAGVRRIRLHDLRHTHATHALQAGVHPKVVSERLGHSS
ncbi:MAG: tyrosine-type recombinase/integrase, partial [Gaiellaceae bacterium]